MQDQRHCRQPLSSGSASGVLKGSGCKLADLPGGNHQLTGSSEDVALEQAERAYHFLPGLPLAHTPCTNGDSSVPFYSAGLIPFTCPPVPCIRHRFRPCPGGPSLPLPSHLVARLWNAPAAP